MAADAGLLAAEMLLAAFAGGAVGAALGPLPSLGLAGLVVAIGVFGAFVGVLSGSYYLAFGLAVASLLVAAAGAADAQEGNGTENGSDNESGDGSNAGAEGGANGSSGGTNESATEESGEQPGGAAAGDGGDADSQSLLVILGAAVVAFLSPLALVVLLYRQQKREEEY